MAAQKKQIFISYSHADREKVDALAQDLVGTGEFDVWHDRSLVGGQAWWDEIMTRLRSSDVMLLALSDKMLASHACQLEREYGTKLNRPFIPVQVDSAMQLNHLPKTLAQWQVIPYYGSKREFDDLLRAIRVAPTIPLPSPLPEAPPIPLSPLAAVRDLLAEASLSYAQQKDIVSVLDWHLTDRPSEAVEAFELLRLLIGRPDVSDNAKAKAEALLKQQARSTPGLKVRFNPLLAGAAIAATLMVVVLLAALRSNDIGSQITPSVQPTLTGTLPVALPTDSLAATLVPSTTTAALPTSVITPSTSTVAMPETANTGSVNAALIFEGRDALTVLVTAPFDLNGLKLVSVNGTTLLAQDFALQAQSPSLIKSGMCFRYVRANGQIPPLPLACDEKYVFRRDLANVDVFWWDDNRSSTLDIAVYRQDSLVKICPADIHCDLSL